MILLVDKIEKSFGARVLFSGASFQINPGERFALVGPNGAGKTTIFNLLTKVYQPTRGSILLDGRDTAGKTTIQVSHMGVARTFQNIRLSLIPRVLPA